jgi:hypothetical protein
MKKVYFLAPAIALAIFLYFYMDFTKEYEAAEVAKIEQAKADRRAELIQEAADRELAIKNALALNAERRAEREAKEATELAKKEARQEAIDARDLADSERRRLAEKVSELERNIAAVEDAIEIIKINKTRLADEAAFLRSYLTVAENNEKEFRAVIQDIRDAEVAHAAALVAAAAAEK